MVQLMFILFAFILTLSGGSCETSASGRIYGGEKVDIKNFPYIVSLQLKNRSQRPHFCGGSIISSRFILTAAHCVVDISKEQFFIKGGTTHLTGKGITRQIEKVILHPKYFRPTTDFDFALLKLEKPLNFSDKRIKTIKLPAPSNKVPIKTGIVAGWGMTNHIWDDFDYLRAVKLEVLEDCSKAKGTKLVITESMFCAEHHGGAGDTCARDSGGPFVIDDVLYGIVSHGPGANCRAANTGAYAKVPYVMKWIMKTIREF